MTMDSEAAMLPSRHERMRRGALGAWWGQGARTAFLMRPDWTGLQVTPFNVAWLVAVPFGLSVVWQRLAVDGPANFYWPALLSGWLQTRAPGLDLMSHDAGHLWWTVFGGTGSVHFGWLHLLSNALLVLGFAVLAWAWPVLYAAQRTGQLATQGIYARMRHPQYVGFILIMFGFLLQWPTLLTLLMFPVLVFMYVRLAVGEERHAAKEFGKLWDDYAARTPRFFPRIGGSREPVSQGRS